jgi:DNA-binding NtrC family response regulator
MPIQGDSPMVSSPTASTLEENDQILPLDELEKQHILSTLQAFEQNRTRTAKHLGISIRTLRNKLNEYQKSAEG